MGIELPTPQGEASIRPNVGPEQQSFMPGVEQGAAANNVELNATERPASQEARTGQGAGDGNGPVSASVAPQTTVAAPQAPVQAHTISLDDVPVVAADEDLIEKQWVDSAKRIIKETRDDPYQQGEALSRLQADYLQKRYGRSVADNGA